MFLRGPLRNLRPCCFGRNRGLGLGGIATVTSQRDAVDGAQLMKIAGLVGPACFAILTMLWVLLLTQEKIPAWLFLLLLLANIPISAAVVWIVYQALTGEATGFARAILSARDIPPPRTYPHQEVLVVQGKYAAAADLYRDHESGAGALRGPLSGHGGRRRGAAGAQGFEGRRYSAGIVSPARSASQKMDTTHQRFPSFKSWMLLIPRLNGAESCAVR